MPRTDPREHANDDVENLFLQAIQPILPKIVGKPCASLDHSQIEPDDSVQQISVLLIEDDYLVLRLFHHRSKPKTWL